jgi:mono/diheme cytochrome c family protein
MPAEEVGEGFFRARCSQCHEVSELGELSAEEWVRRLTALRQDPGPTSDAQPDLLAYLVEHSRKAETMISMVEEKRLFEQSCGKCHPSARIFMMTLSPEQRRHVIRRMREHWDVGASWITTQDAERILAYVEQTIANGKQPEPGDIAGGSKQVFRERCATCHNLERVYRQVGQERGKAAAWVHMVNRMRAKAPEWISEQEAQQIVDYLRSRTHPKKQN